VHEWHELVGEARHGAAYADAADVRATTDTVHPSALGHVALDCRAPTAELHQALWLTVLSGEVSLLVIAGAVAALVYGFTEQPRRPPHLIERNHRRHAGELTQQVEQCLHEIVRLNRTARDVD